MKIGLVVPEHGRASQNGQFFRPSLHRRRLQSSETGSCGEMQVKVAASNSALKVAVHWLRGGAIIAEFNMGGYQYALSR